MAAPATRADRPTSYVLRGLDGAVVELIAGEDGRWHDPGGTAAGQGAGTVDGSGWWAVSGLADSHCHLGGANLEHMNGPEGGATYTTALRNARAQLEAGVFLIGDKGSKNDLSLRLLAEPPGRRPDVWAAAQVITSPGGYYGGFGQEVDEEGLPAAVAVQAAVPGATWVKLIGDWPRKGLGAVPNFGGDALAGAAEVAHAAGCRIAIHACAPRTSSLAVAAGFDSIEHGLFLTLGDLEALGARGGCWVPTVVAMEGLRDELGPSSSGGRLFGEGLENVAALLPRAVAAGVRMLAGTDLRLEHGEVALEAARLVDYGLSPEDAVHAVSRGAYEAFGQRHGFVPGEAADVVFFEQDPREDLTRLARPTLIVRAGRVLVDRRRSAPSGPAGSVG